MRKAFPILTLTALALAIAAGFQGRLDGFGLRPLAVDEYYFAQSIRSVLENGLPSFASGGFYARGLLLQYLTAVGTFFLGVNEFAFRFPSLLLNVGSILLAYFYGRRVAGRQVGLAIALMLLVSSWHIEFARFARMYPAFQFVTLLFLLAVDAAYVRDNRKLRYLPHLVAIAAIFTHELGVLLTPLLFIPLLTREGRSTFPTRGSMARFTLAGLATLMFCLQFQRADLRNWGILDRLPEDYARLADGGPFRLPDFPFWSLSENPFVNVVAICALLLVTALVLLAWKRRRPDLSTTDLLAVLLLVTAAVHSLVLFGALMLLLVARMRILEPARHPRRVYLLVGLAWLIAAGWLVYGWTHPQALGYTAGGPGVADLLRRAFFGWPDFYIPLWLPFWRDFPLLSVSFVCALAYHVLTKIGKPVSEWIGDPACFASYILVCFAILRSYYTETRYLFFIYPVLLCVIASAIVELTVKLVRLRNGSVRPATAAALGAALSVCLFLISNDFNPKHILRVATDEVAYRTGEFERFRNTWYPRLDFRSAAEFVNLHDADDGRSRILVVGQPPVSYYLDRDHAVYLSPTDPRFPNVSRNRGRLELWSNRRLLSTHEELLGYVANADRLWLVEDPRSLHYPFAGGPVWERGVASSTTALKTADGRLQVTRVVFE